jgi:hypothetical protein
MRKFIRAISTCSSHKACARKPWLHEAERGIAGCLAFIEAGNASGSVVARLAQLEQKEQDARNGLAKPEEARQLADAGFDELKAASVLSR